MFKVGPVELKSRLILGTGKYPSPEVMVKCHEASGTDMVTVAVRRVDLNDKTKASFLNWIDRSKIKLLRRFERAERIGQQRLLVGQHFELHPPCAGVAQAFEQLA